MGFCFLLPTLTPNNAAGAIEVSIPTSRYGLLRSQSHLCPPQLDAWISEKTLMARDNSRDVTQKLHKKWLKHQAFMAELTQNKGWLDKIEKVRHVFS